MLLANIINEMSTSKEWEERYFSSGVKGKTLYSNFFSTNVRGFDAVTKQINGIKLDIGKPRSEWRKHPQHGQELSKHYVVPLLSSEAIYKDSHGNYQFSSKSRIMSKIHEEETFNSDEKQLLFLLLNLNYKTVANSSLINEYRDFVSILEKYGVGASQLQNLCMDALSTENKYSLYKNKLFLYMMFFRDIEYGEENNLLKVIIDLTDMEVVDFYNYIKGDIENKKYENLISRRLKPGSNLTRTTVKCMMLLNMVYYVVLNASNGYEKIIDSILETNLHNVNIKTIRSFLLENENMDIFAKVLEDIGLKTNVESVVDLIDESDPTSMYNVSRNNSFFDVAKAIVLEKNDYKCALESIRTCDMNYFTSRKTGHNYIEVHHFLPRKYSNYMQNGVEFIENYVPLCPNCHRMLHLAADNERRSLLFYILDKNDKVKYVLENAEILSSKNIREKLLAVYDFENHSVEDAI